MNRILLICLSIFLLTACGNNGKEDSRGSATTETKAVDDNTVYVYYFHGKQRCMTCNTVEKVAKEVIEANYRSNPNVVFKALDNTDKANEALVEKYEISWNGLIIVKGNDAVNITRQAFANAVKTPDVLVDLIKSEVSRRLN